MKRKSVAQIVIDLAHSNDLRHQKSFSFSGSPEEVFTVTVTRKNKRNVDSVISLEAYANTISALPAGSSCSCCNGSGRSN